MHIAKTLGKSRRISVRGLPFSDEHSATEAIITSLWRSCRANPRLPLSAVDHCLSIASLVSCCHPRNTLRPLPRRAARTGIHVAYIVCRVIATSWLLIAGTNVRQLVDVTINYLLFVDQSYIERVVSCKALVAYWLAPRPSKALKDEFDRRVGGLPLPYVLQDRNHGNGIK